MVTEYRSASTVARAIYHIRYWIVVLYVHNSDIYSIRIIMTLVPLTTYTCLGSQLV